MKAFFSIIWALIVGLVQIAVVLAVFNSLHDRFEVIVVAILGLIYTALRGGLMLIGIANMQYLQVMNRQFVRILPTRTYLRIAINSIVLSWVNLYCLLQLAKHL